MSHLKLLLVSTALLCVNLSGCTVLAIADAAASAAVGVVSTGVKVGTAVVGTAIDVVTPSKDDKKK